MRGSTKRRAFVREPSGVWTLTRTVRGPSGRRRTLRAYLAPATNRAGNVLAAGGWTVLARAPLSETWRWGEAKTRAGAERVALRLLDEVDALEKGRQAPRIGHPGRSMGVK